VILLDTCIFPFIVTGRYNPRRELCISAVTLGEGLRINEDGMAGPIPVLVRNTIAKIEQKDVLPYTHAEARLFSQFAGRIASPKRVADMMIVATALSLGLTLVTADRRMAALQVAIMQMPDVPELMIEIIGT
jgi:predicted nucleic acid-binding protein